MDSTKVTVVGDNKTISEELQNIEGIEVIEEQKKVKFSKKEEDYLRSISINRKTRRNFVKATNAERFLEAKKKKTKVSPRITWQNVPRFSREQAQQMSEKAGFIKGWRSRLFA
jgi:hypothetical protein